MVRSMVVTIAIVTLMTPLWAQQAQAPIPPKTKLQAFEAQYGAVIIHGFSQLGQLRGVYGGTVSVECKEFLNAATSKREYGITIEVKEGGSLERDNTSFVDYDEIGSLLIGLDYIAKVDKSVTKLDDFQADYKTKDDLRVSTFNDQSGALMVAVSSGTIGATTVYLKSADLVKLRDILS